MQPEELNAIVGNAFRMAYVAQFQRQPIVQDVISSRTSPHHRKNKQDSRTTWVRASLNIYIIKLYCSLLHLLQSLSLFMESKIRESLVLFSFYFISPFIDSIGSYSINYKKNFTVIILYYSQIYILSKFQIFLF